MWPFSKKTETGNKLDTFFDTFVEKVLINVKDRLVIRFENIAKIKIGELKKDYGYIMFEGRKPIKLKENSDSIPYTSYKYLTIGMDYSYTVKGLIINMYVKGSKIHSRNLMLTLGIKQIIKHPNNKNLEYIKEEAADEIIKLTGNVLMQLISD